MRKYLVGLVAFLLLLLVIPAWAQVDVQVEGTTVGGGFANAINFTGNVTGSGTGSTKAIDVGGSIEKITGGTETVVAADNGTVFISDDTGTSFTLPAAAAGMTFTFVEGATTNSSTVNAAGTDQFFNYGLPGDTDTLTSSAGRLADSVTVAGTSGGWYVIDTGNAAWTASQN